MISIDFVILLSFCLLQLGLTMVAAHPPGFVVLTQNMPTTSNIRESVWSTNVIWRHKLNTIHANHPVRDAKSDWDIFLHESGGWQDTKMRDEKPQSGLQRSFLNVTWNLWSAKGWYKECHEEWDAVNQGVMKVQNISQMFCLAILDWDSTSVNVVWCVRVCKYECDFESVDGVSTDDSAMI